MQAEQITELMTWLRDAKGFIGDNAPDVAREIMAVGYWGNLIGMITTGVILLVSVVIGIWAIRDNLEVVGVLTLIPLLFSLMGFVITTCKFVYVVMAPKAYLLEQLAGMLKG